MRPTVLALIVLASASVAGGQTETPARDSAVAGELWPTGTFSILAFGPETGEIGATAQPRVFSVGNGVHWAEAGVGAAATQAGVDVSYGPQAIELLRKGMSPE